MKKYALTDFRVSEKCESGLIKEGFSVIKLPPMKDIPSPIASPTDILIFKIENELFLSRKYYEENREALTELPPSILRLTDNAQGEKYPRDAIFNGLVMGKRLFCKSGSFSPEAIKFAEEKGYKICHTNQGYPACTTLKISENAAISADEGMLRTLSREEIRVLKIENGGVSLPPYEYGFIGGAAGIFGDSIYFLGDITRHPSSKAILGFIEKNGKRAVSLSDETFLDLGGILFVSI